MDYLLSYVLIGMSLSFIFDMLNEFVLHSEDKIKFDWGMRIINAILWPYVLGTFINTFVNHNR
jgi:L-asparagine transporter-like permease